MPEPTVETRQTYDAIAAEYARRNSTIDSQLLEDVGSMTASLRPGSLVADVGCGPGLKIALLRGQGFRVVGVDLSMRQLRTAGLPGVAQADMRHLPLRTGSVDAVWCQAALLHIPRKAVPTVLGEFARAVRIGGELYLAVAEGDGESWEVASQYGSDRRRWFTFHRRPDLTALLVASGFEVHQVRQFRAGRDWLSLHARRVPC
jgi:SAM-dependent methyltransferase